ncbi:hypothetical protein ACLD02_01565 [Alloalcanivorax sp. C16-2]|uniref:hypothetical protein n=1 Tax=Alloalcanivorax TaxID=3020832 RepID=UPI0019334C58|nr:hypothetical protein [Alloalcanivorax marinus]MBL7251043.1 hypothetical protein [Alloalcanivorax marinus]
MIGEQEVETLVLSRHQERGSDRLIYRERRLSLTGDGRLRLNHYEEHYRPSRSRRREHSVTVSLEEFERWLVNTGHHERGSGDRD